MTPARNINNELTGQIIQLVCEAWGVTRPDLIGRSRKQPLPWARSQLCQYLRLYAGHDSVSCSALIKHNTRTILDYNYRYQRLLRRYTPFAERDTQIQRAIKELLKTTKQ